MKSYTGPGTLFSQMFMLCDYITGRDQIIQAYKLAPNESLKPKGLRILFISTYRGVWQSPQYETVEETRK